MILINPTLAEVNGQLEQLCERANKGQRVRTVWLQVPESEWEADENGICAGGEGVSNSYRGRATSTLAAVAWFTVSGVRFVRLDASRISAPKSSYGRSSRWGFNLTQRQWESATPQQLVYGEFPGLDAELKPAFDEGFDGNLNNLGPIADWLEDQGLPNKIVLNAVAKIGLVPQPA